MVRNNRRKAFTIVELVIVIAVIAILAAVMIPTFTGIIKRANISADQQLAASINTQLSIYKADGNKIETEADLLNALKSDEDFTAHLNPKSAKHGYHYWYNAEKQTVELMANEDVLNTVQQQSLNAGGDGVAEAAFNPLDFAHAAPRTIVPGFYFLDQIGENENVIAEVFNTLANMSNLTKTEYKGAIDALTAVKGENKGLADKVLERISKTAIMTDKGVFINTTEDIIEYIYVPANVENKADYYLSHTINHTNDDATVKDLATITTKVEGSVIEIPENVKVAEGSFTGFGAITLLVDVKEDKITNLKDVLSAGAVAENAAVRVNGANYTIVGNKVYQGETYMQGADLLYKNPVTNFEIAADNKENNIITIVVQNEDNTTETNHYIAFSKIKNVESPINLVLNAKNFEGTPNVNTPVYEEVVWSEKTDVDGVSIDPKTGKVEFAIDPETGKVKFNADTITFKASAKAVNEGKVEREFTVKVLRLFSAEIGFAEDGSGKATLTNKFENGAFKPTVLESNNLFVGIYADENGAITTKAKFAVPTNFIYAYQNNTVTLSDEQEHYEKLGINKDEITASIAVNNQTYFEFDDNQYLTLKNIGTLNGGSVTQYVVVTVSDGTSTFTGDVGFTLNDNTNSPVTDAFPEYKQESSYVYKVGNSTTKTLPLNELFEKKATNTGDLSNHYLFVFADNVEQGDGYYWRPLKEYSLADLSQINFGDSAYTVGAKYWLMIGEKEVLNGVVGVSTNGTVTNKVRVEVVAGDNITAADFTDLESTTTHAQKTFATNVVLHDNLEYKGYSNKPVIVLSSGADLYANYFTISAKKFYDYEASVSDGYSFIKTTANSTINNLILDGPVYPEIASPNANYFCFGIITEGAGNVINNSYLFGFLSPVRVHGNVAITINNTVLEGGTWSNLWINTANTVNLNNVTTIQNHITGYKPTLDVDNKFDEANMKILGMGIYINDDLADRTTDENADTVEVTINLNSVTQYNWVSQNMTGFGGNVDLAKSLVFNENNSYSAFYHKVGEVDYVNAAIVYQCADFSVVEANNLLTGYKWKESSTAKWAIEKVLGASKVAAKNMPTIIVNDTSNTINGSNITYNSLGKKDNEFRIEGSKLSALTAVLGDLAGALEGVLDGYRFGVDVWAASPKHPDTGVCNACLDKFNANVFSTFNPVSNYNE